VKAWGNGERRLVELWKKRKKNGSESATDGVEEV
jgi:hypothetical protein